MWLWEYVAEYYDHVNLMNSWVSILHFPCVSLHMELQEKKNLNITCTINSICFSSRSLSKLPVIFLFYFLEKKDSSFLSKVLYFSKELYSNHWSATWRHFSAGATNATCYIWRTFPNKPCDISRHTVLYVQLGHAPPFGVKNVFMPPPQQIEILLRTW